MSPTLANKVVVNCSHLAKHDKEDGEVDHRHLCNVMVLNMQHSIREDGIIFGPLNSAKN